MPEEPFTAIVVLVVQAELCDRVSTAKHLRKSGFDVNEAATVDEARRVLDAGHVDVVFVDLEMPGRTNGLALLRRLRERQPAIKTILTSATEMDMAAVEGCGIFLSKPYRMIDLDYCLRRILAANDPADQADASASADRRQTQAADDARSRDGESSRPLMGELSRQLAERVARQRAVDPVVAKAARRSALQAHDRARARRLRLAVGFALGAVAAAGIVNVVPLVGSQPVPLAAARTEPAPSVEMASATPSPAESVPYGPAVEPVADQMAAAPEPTAPSPLSDPASVAASEASMAATAESAMAGQPVSVEPAPDQTPLRRDEVREVQARLRSFGFHPGAVDGAAGPRTASATLYYQQARGQSQTGTVDRDLLEQLRQDPAPQPARRAATRAPAPRRDDPFESVRSAGDRLGRWLESRLR